MKSLEKNWKMNDNDRKSRTINLKTPTKNYKSLLEWFRYGCKDGGEMYGSCFLDGQYKTPKPVCPQYTSSKPVCQGNKCTHICTKVSNLECNKQWKLNEDLTGSKKNRFFLAAIFTKFTCKFNKRLNVLKLFIFSKGVANLTQQGRIFQTLKKKCLMI